MNKMLIALMSLGLAFSANAKGKKECQKDEHGKCVKVEAKKEAKKEEAKAAAPAPAAAAAPAAPAAAPATK